MAIASIKLPIAYPGYCAPLTGAITHSSNGALDAAGEYMAWVFQAVEDMTVSHVGFRNFNVSGASPSYDVRIETVGTDGIPTGTLWATNTNAASGTVAASTHYLVALTASASITKGQFYAVKLVYAAGTSVTPSMANNIIYIQSNNPYFVTNTTGSAVKSKNTLTPFISLGSSSTTFYQIPGSLPVGSSGIATNSFNNTNSAAKGLLFRLPFAASIIGARWHANSTAGDFTMLLTEGTASPSTLLSKTIDGDYQGAAASGVVEYKFDSSYTLAANTTARLLIEPSSATNCGFIEFVMPSNAYATALPLGSYQQLTARASGTFTETDTRVPFIDILLDGFYPSEGSGGVPGIIS